jgi:integrase
MSINKRKNGSWEVRYRDPDGVHRSKSFSRKLDAVAFEISVRNSINTGAFQVPLKKRITVEEIYWQYLKSKQGLKPKSAEEIRTIWNHIIAPEFANTQVTSINLERIHKWIDNFVYSENAKTSKIRMNKALGYFNRIMDFAIELGYITKNPLIRPNGKQMKIDAADSSGKRLTKALTLGELTELATNCGYHEDMVLLMGICGLRWAEVIGLKASDFDENCQKLKVSRTLSEINGLFHETTTKTNQDRIVYIPKSLAEMLEKRISRLEPNDLVFTNERGKPLHNSNFRSRIYLPAIARSNTPKVTIHDLRHTAASIAISSGADVTSVARLLGHSNTSMTLNRYSHYYDKNLKSLSENLNVLLENEMKKDNPRGL